ncbi:MAG: hypothetical protein N2V78_12320 [Methanophagales archaeon]|nr:hypothetical protein [Methanophagales archaeon]
MKNKKEDRVKTFVIVMTATLVLMPIRPSAANAFVFLCDSDDGNIGVDVYAANKGECTNNRRHKQQ